MALLDKSVKAVYGRNVDVDAGTEDIISAGGTYAGPAATASVVNFASASANDTAAGTGARIMEVVGLDSAYTERTETITLLGATPVPTANGFFFISSVRILTAGSGGVNAGIITGTSAASGTPVLITMAASTNKSCLGVYMVPAEFSAVVRQFGGNMVQASGTVAINLSIKPFGGVFEIHESLILASGAYASARREYTNQGKVALAKSIIKLTGTSSAADSDVFGFIDIQLIGD